MIESTNFRTAFHETTTNNLALHSYADYYPFGWRMPGRQKNPGSYRFAYQGQERDNEPGTEWEAFELRLWDGSLAFWHVLKTALLEIGVKNYVEKSVKKNKQRMLDICKDFELLQINAWLFAFCYINIIRLLFFSFSRRNLVDFRAGLSFWFFWVKPKEQ